MLKGGGGWLAAKLSKSLLQKQLVPFANAICTLHWKYTSYISVMRWREFFYDKIIPQQM